MDPLFLRALEMLAEELDPEAREARDDLPTTWQPQSGPQKELVTTYRDHREVFFGGARGGGKTDGMLGDWIEHWKRYRRAARGAFFRRYHIDLEDVVRRGRDILSPLGFTWNETSHTFKAPDGATLKVRHCKDELAAERYQGHAYTRVYIEEVQQWPSPAAIDRLRGTLRSVEGVICGLRLTGNPGGPGHSWVRMRYIDPAPEGFQDVPDPETGHTRIFIPSRLEDNKLLMQADPEYEARLLGVGDPQLVKAWRWGHWDVLAGGFFNGVWDPQRCVIRSFPIPPTWRFFYALDWGFSKPSSLGLYAVSDGTPVISGPMRGRVFPRGSVVRFDEMYTISIDRNGTPQANTGLRLENYELGARIGSFLRRDDVPSWAWGVADPSIFHEQGGPSIYDHLRRGARAGAGFPLSLRPADNTRVTGWQRVVELFRGAGELERPGLYITSNCVHFLRTVPSIKRDDKNFDDIDTESEDHAADELRYAVMSLSAAPRISIVRSGIR